MHLSDFRVATWLGVTGLCRVGVRLLLLVSPFPLLPLLGDQGTLRYVAGCAFLSAVACCLDDFLGGWVGGWVGGPCWLHVNGFV